LLPDNYISFLLFGVEAFGFLSFDSFGADFLGFPNLVTEKLQHKFVVSSLVDSEFGEALVVLLIEEGLFLFVKASDLGGCIV